MENVQVGEKSGAQVLDKGVLVDGESIKVKVVLRNYTRNSQVTSEVTSTVRILFFYVRTSKFVIKVTTCFGL